MPNSLLGLRGGGGGGGCPRISRLLWVAELLVIKVQVYDAPVLWFFITFCWTNFLSKVFLVK